MRVFNETSRRMCAMNRTIRVIVAIDDSDETIEFGYCDKNDPLLSYCLLYDGSCGITKSIIRATKELQEKLLFSKLHGAYIIPYKMQPSFIRDNIYQYGRRQDGGFPYTFGQYYEAFNNFELFKGKQKIVDNYKYKLSDYLRYTFGVEFETSMGFVPQPMLFRDGLIPLRDGSISGLEYSTVVLEPETGINLLKQQVDTLKEYTFFNKECSLHIHLGGYPVEEKAIFMFYTIVSFLEGELMNYIPEWSFFTAKYKATGKDYCKPLQHYSSFNSLYEGIAEKEYEGSLYDPHPNDRERSHKWDCHARYVWCNILNMICYDKAKTIEFRFLRPTYNFYKIYLWLYIFNAILIFAEKMTTKFESKSELEIIRHFKKNPYLEISNIVSEVYPNDIAKSIIDALRLLRIAVINQSRNGDFIGKDTFYDEIINEESICGLL